jgi:hypothetical protein
MFAPTRELCVAPQLLRSGSISCSIGGYRLCYLALVKSPLFYFCIIVAFSVSRSQHEARKFAWQSVAVSLALILTVYVMGRIVTVFVCF